MRKSPIEHIHRYWDAMLVLDKSEIEKGPGFHAVWAAYTIIKPDCETHDAMNEQLFAEFMGWS